MSSSRMNPSIRVSLTVISVMILLVIELLFRQGSAFAATYCTANPEGNCYVDGEVEASGDGKTPTSAFKTIQEAADVVGPGDTVNVKGGVCMRRRWRLSTLAL